MTGFLADFLASWELFGTTYAVGILAAAALAQAGVWVVARDQIFLGAAVAQASALGVAVAWFAGAALAAGVGGLEEEVLPGVLAVGASVLTAWAAARPSRLAGTSSEARNGWVFLLASSLPVLLLARQAHGLEEMERLLFSTLLAARPIDLGLFALVGAASAALTAGRRDALLLWAADPDAAAAAGLRPGRWRLLSAVWVGVTVGLAIRATGALFAFGCLVLPALVMRGVAREVRSLVWLAPACAASAALAGFAVAHALDWPPAHTTVAILCALLPLSWLRAR